MNTLARIKQLTLRHRLAFTQKVDKNLESFSLTRRLVREAIYNAPIIYKTVRFKNPRMGAVETQYVLKGKTFDGQFIEAKVRIDASRKTGLIEKARRLIPPPTGWKCPTCGKKALIRVKKSFRFENDGVVMPKLDRLQCQACKEDLFDLHAMDTIEKFRHPHRKKDKRVVTVLDAALMAAN
jgi:hypothetical protein